MSTSTHLTPPEHGTDSAGAFVAAVRARLADLSDEQRDELLDGLEADLAEQRADGAPSVDPTAYAAELRAAAGLPPAPTTRVHGWGRGRRAGLGAALDRLRGAGADLLERHRWLAGAWALVVVVRPAWWVLRAWVAATLLDQWTGPSESVTLLPTLAVPGLGVLVLLAAVVVSVLVGLGRLWPGGTGRSAPARVVLAALNTVAVLLALAFTTSDGSTPDSVGDYDLGYRDGVSSVGPAVLRVDGEPVTNVFAYDLAGRPLAGVQLVDQDGRPLSLLTRRAAEGRRAERTVGCPWFNGTTPLFNVFPLQERTQRRLWCLADDPAAGAVVAPAAPLAGLSPVSREAGGAVVDDPAATAPTAPPG